MSVSYYYSITGSFPSASIATSKLHDEINVELSSSGFEFVNVFGDDVNTYFTSSLSAPDETILDTIISLHDGIPYTDMGTNLEDFLTLDGNRTMSGSLQMGNNSIVSASSINDVVVESHKERHIRGGEDIVDGDRIVIDYTPNTYTPNASIPQAGDTKDLSAHLAGIDSVLSSSLSSMSASVFGKNFVYNEVTIPFSTTGHTFLKSNTMNFTWNDTSKIRVGWSYIWSHDSVANDIEVRIMLDNSVELLSPRHREEPSDAVGTGYGGTDQRHLASGFKYLTLTPGNHSISLEVRSPEGSDDSTIHYSSLEAWRVS